jgi:hypothetical protein
VRHRAARFSLTRFSTAESSTTGALDDWRLVGSCQPSVFGCQVRALCGHRRRTSGRGHRGTPRHRSKFASLDVYSAWRLLPDVQTGIAHIKSDNTFHEVVAGVLHAGRPRRGERPLRRSARHATCTALHCTALHCTKVTLRGRGHRASRVESSTAPSWPPPPSARLRLWSIPSATRWTVSAIYRTRSPRFSSPRFGCGRTTTPCASRRNSLLFIPTQCDTDSAESRTTPAGPFRGHAMVAELCLTFEAHRQRM